jgi:hypothetical protein
MLLIGYYTVVCTIWKYIVRVGMVLKPRIVRDAAGVESNTGFQYNIYYTAEMINTILCLSFNSLNRRTAQQYFVRNMFCINTDLVSSKNELKTAK